MLHFLSRGDTRLSVNFPQIELQQQMDSHRILHIHKNVAGIIAGVSRVFAASDFNITGQSLRTTQDIGYAIFDVSGTINNEILAALWAVPGTIKVRVLS